MHACMKSCMSGQIFCKILVLCVQVTMEIPHLTHFLAVLQHFKTELCWPPNVHYILQGLLISFSRERDYTMLQGMPAQDGSSRRGAARREATTTACRSQQKAEMSGSKKYLDIRGVSSIQSPLHTWEVSLWQVQDNLEVSQLFTFI
jgi:hypothetical protein